RAVLQIKRRLKSSAFQVENISPAGLHLPGPLLLFSGGEHAFVLLLHEQVGDIRAGAPVERLKQLISAVLPRGKQDRLPWKLQALAPGLDGFRSLQRRQNFGPQDVVVEKKPQVDRMLRLGFERLLLIRKCLL